MTAGAGPCPNRSTGCVGKASRASVLRSIERQQVKRRRELGHGGNYNRSRADCEQRESHRRAARPGGEHLIDGVRGRGAPFLRRPG